ncbi:MAG: hypothetical protein L3K16_06470 [Thermoplasmata archaeon]|nr:hypothetical protein [Thermoplasmata archaeon]
MNRTPALVLVATALLAATMATGVALAPAPIESHLPSRDVTTVVRPAGNTSINDDVSLNGSAPAGTYAPGTVVHVTYRVTVVSASSGGSAVTVYFPQMLATFAATPAPVNLFLPPRNLTAGVGATATGSPGTFTIRNATSFNGTRTAALNSQLVSLMGSEPFGDLTVSVQWNWTLTTANGATSSSGWGPSPSPAIEPAEIATLASLTPRALAPPAPVTACLTGPLQGRTFSLHAETPKPFDDFVGNSTRDPVGGPSTWCLTVVIPVNITPQTILMHVWDYEAVTLLLYIVKVKVGNNTTTPESYGLPGTWSDYANGVIGLGAVGVGVTTVVVVRREPPVRTPADEPPRG